MSGKALVLVLGATGSTGRPITQALLESGEFRVAIITRPSSTSKLEVNDLRSKGAEIRVADIHSDSVQKLTEVLSGVDVLISTVNATAILDQKPIFAAAKEAGVKRVIPCDFATPGARGVRTLNDQKLTIRDYIKELGIGYTFIDIGPLSHEVYGAGDKKMLVTNVEHVGRFVAKIIADERTLNQYVIIWEDEVTLQEAQALGEKYSGEAASIRAKRTYVTHEELIQRAAAGKKEDERSSSIGGYIQWTHFEYMISMHILGENSLENAKALGALDARALYPDVPTMTLEEFARECYGTVTQL